MSDSPFDPPKPDDPSALEMAGIIAAAFGVLAADVASGGVLSSLGALPDLSDERRGPPDIQPLLASIADTSAPEVDARGNPACTRCGTHVPYSTMSLSEHGYFCAACAAELARAPSAE